MWMGEIHISAEDPVSVSTRVDGPDGVIMRSADERWVAQFRLDGLTVSRLAPYTSWDDLKRRTMELWEQYRAAAQPTGISRVAARFINRIPLPQGQPFDRTFSTTFAMAADLPQAVAGFLLRVIVPFPAEESMAIVTQSLEAGSGDCLFDLDAFAERAGGFMDDEAWEKLETLRDVKNRLFFGSLTSEALERFR